jgi:hypothetical protein
VRESERGPGKRVESGQFVAGEVNVDRPEVVVELRKPAGADDYR